MHSLYNLICLPKTNCNNVVTSSLPLLPPFPSPVCSSPLSLSLAPIPYLLLLQASISSLSQFTEDTIPLTPRAGEPDYLGAEEQLVEDSDNAPDGLAIDPVLLANGGEEKEEKVGGNGSNGISDVVHHNDTHS